MLNDGQKQKLKDKLSEHAVDICEHLDDIVTEIIMEIPEIDEDQDITDAQTFLSLEIAEILKEALRSNKQPSTSQPHHSHLPG